MQMIERKMVVSRRGKIRTLFPIALALISAVVASLTLVSPLFPPSTIQVPVHIPPPPQAVSYEPGFTFPEITFETPSLEANTTLFGNVTLCCLKALPRTAGGSTYLSTPSLFIFSENEYIQMRGKSLAVPWNSPSEASIWQDAFRNYTLNGPTGTETLSIHFTAKDPGVYYFVVESSNGEAEGHLYLTYYKSQIVQNQWVPFWQLIFGVLTVVGFIWAGIEGYHAYKTRKEMVRFRPRQLFFNTHFRFVSSINVKQYQSYFTCLFKSYNL
jgi:hypothetical protein